MTTSKAYVFDIKRFAVHDGYGIRTTIFFKGCPLRCKWCQNPEGLETKPRVLWFEKNCIHCRLCEKASMPNQMHYDERPYLIKNIQVILIIWFIFVHLQLYVMIQLYIL